MPDLRSRFSARLEGSVMTRVVLVALGFALTFSLHAQTPPRTTIQYARDVQPILSTHCFLCHGPNDKDRKAGLRLDLVETATKTLKSGSRAIVPGDSKNSELIARIYAEGSERMPPPKSNHTLKETEKQILKRWI